jgi:hypothetical protein
MGRDGKTLIMAGGSWDPTIRVWDIASRKELRALQGHTDYIDTIALAPDGRLLCSGSRDGTLRLWDLAAGRELRPFPTAPGGYRCVAYAPDSKMIAAGSPDHTIRLWETATRKERLQLRGHTQPPNWLAFTPSGRVLVSGADDRTIRLWDTLTGEELHQLRGHQEAVRCLAFAPGGRQLASASDDSTVLVWDVTRWANYGLPPAADLTPAELDALWADLAAEDAGRAWSAAGQLIAGRQSAVPFLTAHLRPVPAVDRERIARLVADLDSEVFQVRRQAAAGLEALGDLAEPALRRARAESPSPEVRKAAELLLAKVDVLAAGEHLRPLRAVEVLERIGTTEVRAALERLAGGAPEARVTREAKLALERLGGSR